VQYFGGRRQGNSLDYGAFFFLSFSLTFNDLKTKLTPLGHKEPTAVERCDGSSKRADFTAFKKSQSLSGHIGHRKHTQRSAHQHYNTLTRV